MILGVSMIPSDWFFPCSVTLFLLSKCSNNISEAETIRLNTHKYLMLKNHLYDWLKASVSYSFSVPSFAINLVLLQVFSTCM